MLKLGKQVLAAAAAAIRSKPIQQQKENEKPTTTAHPEYRRCTTKNNHHHKKIRKERGQKRDTKKFTINRKIITIAGNKKKQIANPWKFSHKFAIGWVFVFILGDKATTNDYRSEKKNDHDKRSEQNQNNNNIQNQSG